MIYDYTWRNRNSSDQDVYSEAGRGSKEKSANCRDGRCSSRVRKKSFVVAVGRYHGAGTDHHMVRSQEDHDSAFGSEFLQLREIK